MDATTGIGSQMGKDQFLQLFASQMKMQNPMNPSETGDFLAQLAQFSSVEQMGNLSGSFEELLTSQRTTQAAQLVGKSVSFVDPASEKAKDGLVSGVNLTEDGPMLLVGNEKVDFGWVTRIYQENQAVEEDQGAGDSEGSPATED